MGDDHQQLHSTFLSPVMKISPRVLMPIQHEKQSKYEVKRNAMLCNIINSSSSGMNNERTSDKISSVEIECRTIIHTEKWTNKENNYRSRNAM